MNKKQKVAKKITKRARRKATADKTTDKRNMNAQIRYKDTVFRMLFKEKENLLSLYNAVNRSSYTEVDTSQQ